MIDSERTPQTSGPDWLQIAKDSFSSSTTYLDANFRKPWERNIALFQSRHPDGSKYNSEAYKKRSRLFRPKTKSVVRKNEAAAASAFFANVDVVAITTDNDSDPMQVKSAELMNEVVNYRLTKTIPWYMLLIGALQDAQVMGIVASYQHWKYKEKPTSSYEPVLDDLGQPLVDESGAEYFQEVAGTEVVEDKPCIELIPIENIRFDPGADWTDIVGTSPYVIRMVPMYVDSVRQMMKEADPKTGAPKWKNYSDNEIREAMVSYDTIRQQREGKRQDPLAQNDSPIKEFDIVWCHENFVRLDGQEMQYWTLGTQHLLTEPRPLAEAYFHGERPIVIGCAVMEAHKAVPESLVAIGSELQKEVNETVNQRRDNVSLVLNKRYFAARNAQVDVDSLLKNVPGSVTMMNSVTDVQPVEWNDVTASSYQEQDRLNVDFDELTGNFSQGSVQTNRKLNETVGGMNLMAGGASQMTEYLLRTFVETWVEPVLRQLVALEKHYETDEVVIGMVGSKAGIPPEVSAEIMAAWQAHDLTVAVNVGMGATDPKSKLAKFTFALQTYAQTMGAIPDADPEAVRREVFGLAGYKDGSRFFKKQDDPAIAQMQQQMQQLQQAFEGVVQELEATKQDKTAQAIKAQADAQKASTDEQVAVHEAATKDALTSAQIDLIQAQTVKTLKEAEAVAPEEEPEQEPEQQGPDPVESLAKLVEANGEQMSKAVEQIAEATTKGQQQIAEAMQAIAQAMSKPKSGRVVKNPDGSMSLESA